VGKERLFENGTDVRERSFDSKGICVRVEVYEGRPSVDNKRKYGKGGREKGILELGREPERPREGGGEPWLQGGKCESEQRKKRIEMAAMKGGSGRNLHFFAGMTDNDLTQREGKEGTFSRGVVWARRVGGRGKGYTSNRSGFRAIKEEGRWLKEEGLQKGMSVYEEETRAARTSERKNSQSWNSIQNEQKISAAAYRKKPR